MGNSLAVQWLGLHISTAGGTGLIPGRGTKVLHATWCGQTPPPQNSGIMWYIYTVEYNSVVKRNEVLIRATT